ncbi:hypothetical protein HAX54_031688, partial [Datura stramonium]|nr:hypothetical protein [Datura stramonium]
AYRNNEKEEHHAQRSDIVKHVLEQMEVIREKLTKQGKSLKKMSSKLTEMMAKVATCNDFHVTVLVNTQGEPHVEEKKLRQEIDQCVSSIHDLWGLLNEKIEASEAQLQSVMDTSQCMEQKKEFQPLDCSLLVDVDVEKVDKSEDVNHNSILKLGCIGPHSKCFSTLCFVGNLEMEPSKPMERCVDEE